MLDIRIAECLGGYRVIAKNDDGTMNCRFRSIADVVAYVENTLRYARLPDEWPALVAESV